MLAIKVLSQVRKWCGEIILQVREKSGNIYLESGKIDILKKRKFNLTRLIFFHQSQGNVAAM